MTVEKIEIQLFANTLEATKSIRQVQSELKGLESFSENVFENMRFSISQSLTKILGGDSKGWKSDLLSIAKNIKQGFEQQVFPNFIKDSLFGPGFFSYGSGGGQLGGIFKELAGNSTGGSLIEGLFGGQSANSFFSKVLGGIFGGARANGGPVMGGVPYLVGERGPEIFVPGASGRVLPNGQGGGMTVNMTVVTPDAGSFRASQGQILAETAQHLRRAQRNL